MSTSIDPFRNTLLGSSESYTDDQIEKILGQAAIAQKRWKETSFEQRAVFFRRLASVLIAEKTHLSELATKEMGKTIVQAEAEVEKCAIACEYYATHGEEFLKAKKMDSDASLSYVRYDPLGVILAVMPWNYPYWQVFRFAVPALMAGNTGILKHASNVSFCALAMEQLFIKAGFPSHVFQVVITDASGVKKIIEDKRIKGVALTGSEKAGASIASIAGANIKKTVMELGGSDPFIVLEDADLELCADVAVKSRTINNGQSCIAAKRFIVTASVYDRFLKLFQEKMEKLKTGDPMLRTTDVGPMARKDLLEQLNAQLQKSIQAGAILITGGKIIQEQNIMTPAILTNVRLGMPAYHEELFGPVASVIKVENEDEAIRVANDTVYGLASSVWTQDQSRGERVAAQIEAGAVFINGMVKSDSRLPFGGVKMSGYGRELSLLGIHEFVNVKTVWVK